MYVIVDGLGYQALDKSYKVTRKATYSRIRYKINFLGTALHVILNIGTSARIMMFQVNAKVCLRPLTDCMLRRSQR